MKVEQPQMRQMAQMKIRKPLRLWPGVIAASLLIVVRFLLPVLLPEARPFGFPIGIVAMLGGAVFGIGIILWWLFASRAPWRQRIEAVLLMALAVVATRFLLHESTAGEGAGAGAGALYYFYVLSSLPPAFVVWAVASRQLSSAGQRTSMVAAIVIGCAIWTLVRIGGISGNGNFALHWRWMPSAEERLMAASPSPVSNTAPAVVPVTVAEGGEDAKPVSPLRIEWAGFRGTLRDGVVRGVHINTDWNSSPPLEMWRRPIGPGWSSFAVASGLIYTQEQRGGEEFVACYRLSNGELVWSHRDRARFYEAAGGAGPRGTPTVHADLVYAMGATGILNALDARSGKPVWSRNTATDTGVALPDWGIASSPLVFDDLVIVAVSGRLVAYDLRTGEQRWLGPKGGGGYSSPHLVTIDGVPQVVLQRGGRTVSVAPADGALLWDHTWVPSAGFLQPSLVDDRDLLLTTGDSSGIGMRRVSIGRTSKGWTAQERWTSRALKPYFNDFVVHRNHAYGFDGSILASINLADGERAWKGGRYGHGQMILLADQDLLLVLSEEGELALVSATTDKFTEIARFKVIEGKTWNHPVLIDDVLLVRNGEEMAAFKLPLARSLTGSH